MILESIGLAGFVLFLSYGLTRSLTLPTSRLRLLDRPNERSLHTEPTPRTGGLAILGCFLTGVVLAWIADEILVTSKAYLGNIEKHGVGTNKLHYFPQSAEELYRPVAIESNAPENQLVPVGFRVMFAGNIGVAQDFATILDAAAILKDCPDIHWIVVGDGRMRRWVETQVQVRTREHTN